jgi:hypothetical protein
MKHLKRFDKIVEGNTKDLDWITNRRKVWAKFIDGEFTPPTEKLHIKSIYKYIIIELEGGRSISIDKDVNIELWTSLDRAVRNIDEETYEDTLFDGIEDFKSSKCVVDVLEYNPVNYHEIENILLEYGYHVVNIWAAIY